MKLIEAHVTDYRNILDSNPVEIAQSTCLVGKNEAGKTAFLKALEGLRSLDPAYVKFDRTECYPRRYLADYGERHPGGEAVVIKTKWRIEDDDRAALEDELGEGVVNGDEVTITKRYETQKSTWSVPVDDGKVVSLLYKRFNLTKEERDLLKEAKTCPDITRILEPIKERSERQDQLLAAIKTFRDNDAMLRAMDILDARTPKFL